MKNKILDDMLAKGYINEEKYREWKLDEHFSAEDAATYRHIAEAYADKRYITLEEFERRMNNAVYNKSPTGK